MGPANGPNVSQDFRRRVASPQRAHFWILHAQAALRCREVFEVPVLTGPRIRAAYGVAVVTDALQLLMGPVGWAFADEILDIAAMIAISRLIGFHPLLLPTLVLELVPLADLLPTWTGAVALVLTLRRRSHPQVPPPSDGQVIDV